MRVTYEQFLLFSTIFCYLLLDSHVKIGTIFSHRDNRLFEISEVEITRVDCSLSGPENLRPVVVDILSFFMNAFCLTEKMAINCINVNVTHDTKALHLNFLSFGLACLMHEKWCIIYALHQI